MSSTTPTTTPTNTPIFFFNGRAINSDTMTVLGETETAAALTQSGRSVPRFSDDGKNTFEIMAFTQHFSHSPSGIHSAGSSGAPPEKGWDPKRKVYFIYNDRVVRSDKRGIHSVEGSKAASESSKAGTSVMKIINHQDGKISVQRNGRERVFEDGAASPALHAGTPCISPDNSTPPVASGPSAGRIILNRVLRRPQTQGEGSAGGSEQDGGARAEATSLWDDTSTLRGNASTWSGSESSEDTVRD